MKKKIIAMSLAMVMVVGVGKGIVASAETYKQTENDTDGAWTDDNTTTNDDNTVHQGEKIDDDGVTSQKTITVTSAVSTKKYSVDISWGNMSIKDEAAEWNPDGHSYSEVNANWTDPTNGGKITVTNHSNALVTSICSFAYIGSSAGDKYVTDAYPNSTLNVNVDSNKDSFELETAENVPYRDGLNYTADDGIQGTHELNVAGALRSTEDRSTENVGTVTISLSQTEE